MKPKSRSYRDTATEMMRSLTDSMYADIPPLEKEENPKVLGLKAMLEAMDEPEVLAEALSKVARHSGESDSEFRKRVLDELNKDLKDPQPDLHDKEFMSGLKDL